MQFKHPEILYALLLLIIPILVHLFQLQRFIKVPFTNVQLLKSIEKQTRKSARLKKWLVLSSRILIFTGLIIAFAQPYLSEYSTQKKFNTTVYLDNSFSMQAKGVHGELLKSAAQSIIKNTINQSNTISLITNEKTLKNLDTKTLKNELIQINYSSRKLNLNTILLKAQQFNNTEGNDLNKIIVVSDFQSNNIGENIDFSAINSDIQFVKLTPTSSANVFIDSVYLEQKSALETIIKVLIKSTKKSKLTIPISLYSEATLIGKTTSKFVDSNSSIVQFSIPNSNNFNGKLTLIDNALSFDNEFYFSISKPEKINVMSIGSATAFLPKIFSKNEFNFTTSPLKNLNYNSLQNQHLIILNEIDKISIELTNALFNFSKNGGSIVIIPSPFSNIDSYNSFLSALNLGKITKKISSSHKITAINYEHPLIRDVFERRVDNFKYPKTSGYYQTNLNNASSIIELDDNHSFISSIKTFRGTTYVISSPLNIEVSDFIQSPLVVPIFYNFAKNSLKYAKLYSIISSKNEIEVKTTINKDHVLKVTHENNTDEFIPLQTILQNKVVLNFQDYIQQSGFYKISNGDTTIKTIAFNYNRKESDLNIANIETLAKNNKGVHIAPSIDAVFNEINNQQEINWLFKWFLTFSVLFLLLEMLILKYFNK